MIDNEIRPYSNENRIIANFGPSILDDDASYDVIRCSVITGMLTMATNQSSPEIGGPMLLAGVLAGTTFIVSRVGIQWIKDIIEFHY